MECNAIPDAVACGVLPCHLQRDVRNVGCGDPRRRTLARKRHRDASASGTYVGRAQVAIRLGEQFERRFDDQFRFVAGDQHRRRHPERQAPGFLLSDDVSEGLTADPPLDERFIPAREVGWLGLASGRDESLGRPAKDKLGEQARIELGAPAGEARIAKPATGIGDVVVNAGQAFRPSRLKKPPWRL